MNKLQLSALLLGGALSTNAQSSINTDTLNVDITKDTIELYGGTNYRLVNKWARSEAEIIYVGPGDVVNLNLNTGVPNDSVLVHVVHDDYYHFATYPCTNDTFSFNAVSSRQSGYYKIIVFGVDIDTSNTNIDYIKVPMRKAAD